MANNQKKKIEAFIEELEEVKGDSMIEEIKVENNIPQEPERKPDAIVMSVKEFASSLKGTDLLLASAMKRDYTGLKKTKEEWMITLKKFGAMEV